MYIICGVDAAGRVCYTVQTMAHESSIWEFMRGYQETNGIPPTMREIAEEIGLTHRSSVRYAILRLRQTGLAEASGAPNTQRRWRATNGRNVENQKALVEVEATVAIR